MLLSGSSYFTRDIYRPFVDRTISERDEDRLGRIGVVVFAVAALLASIWAEGGGIGAATVGSLLVDIGDLAFGGFAQLSPVVLLALYWRKTTRAGMYAGVLVPQVVYVAFNFLPVTALGGVSLFAERYFGWGISVYGMLLALVVTAGVSVITAAPASGERRRFFEETEE